MPIFTFPLAFIGLLAVPALVAIYWLRSRSKEHTVSSLLLWIDEKQVWEGGRKIHRLQTPLLFFLELLAILLLVTTAAGPMIRASDGARPLVIVLDDSFSMLAGREVSARDRARRAIENELGANRYEPVRFVLAAETPQSLGEAGGNAEQSVKLLKAWNCSASASKLEEAIAFAFELGGNRARVLVITDHAPAQDPSDSRLQWWSFGTQQPNAAFVNATRTVRDDQELVLFEVANLSSQSNPTTLTIESTGLNNPQSISLAANETRRIVLTIKGGPPPLIARLSDDALSIDNKVVLAPEMSKQVRVDLRVLDARLRTLVEKALQSSRNILLKSGKPQLAITDEVETGVESQETWMLRMISEKDAVSFLGPFVVDRAHPLGEGLSLGGVVWAAGRGTQFPGTPIITAGNTPLLTDIERAGSHEMRLRFRPDLSTLQETPNWPILIWNIINWRARSAPGMNQTNVRLGTEAALKVETGVEAVEVTDPDLNTKQLAVHDNAVNIKPEKAGLYKLETNRNSYAFAANALQREESDLTKASSGRWGNWANAAELQWEYRSLAWVCLLLAMIVLAIHAWLVRAR